MRSISGKSVATVLREAELMQRNPIGLDPHGPKFQRLLQTFVSVHLFETWSQKPYLPLRRRTKHGDEQGILHRHHGPVVFLVSLRDLESWEGLTNVRQVRYESFDHLIAAGWLVEETPS